MQTAVDYAILTPLVLWLAPALVRPRSPLTMAISLTILLVGMGAVAIRKMALPSNLFVCRNPECGMRTCLGCDREVCAAGPRRGCGNGGAGRVDCNVRNVHGMHVGPLAGAVQRPVELASGGHDGRAAAVHRAADGARTRPHVSAVRLPVLQVGRYVPGFRCPNVYCVILAAHAHVAPHCRPGPAQAATR
jgi:hypothetical protein